MKSLKLVFTTLAMAAAAFNAQASSPDVYPLGQDNTLVRVGAVAVMTIGVLYLIAYSFKMKKN